MDAIWKPKKKVRNDLTPGEWETLYKFCLGPGLMIDDLEKLQALAKDKKVPLASVENLGTARKLVRKQIEHLRSENKTQGWASTAAGA